ncbi:tRNA-dihydrouridine synthase 2 [Yamadazyma tenuis]|uniref:FMN-linked oxidoreductase n=1 Tax=Candida tenuis (strain ATCC 10573 / BCRC 21748 / CBS 615 / JCM 9827 / NBRC 10315 / NRRL Y-1498 / VKM Y-70) TaxID=590646 RepID=G3BBH1_CANTC|nr:FMN-linked oxidoreductase [Yamadazyma tenuis ATCC 10573]XP_006688983.1 uncharacterized protein CANTEDRAFT_115656 [Yamadazyma tenuis ATCC 10573]EGV62812.1 FMN-linked oxidoreductase [Yamadazyma tenuis ATCC 10573]EGV62813.1 hypothetical protein CANTEDRAFT_115656 [Yamadazyma tenuis ATCC 10573]WEJ93447.1 tRNA-dihydrouridine synthase 2 [Yamadazyma tenuis]
MNYTGKFVLAPMVRSGELPTRLLALRHGADLVWSPEIVDKKLLTCTRSYNSKLNTTEFREPNGRIALSTYKPSEAGKLIFQMGSSSPELAVKAGLMVINDVDGIDLNCGCPKNFSVHSGMGAALLSTPTLLCDILKSLVQKVGDPNNKPISCKIRLLGDLPSTLELVEQICQTGIKNLTLHCRTRSMRNREEPLHDYVPEIIKITKKYNISFIINGNLRNRLDFFELQQRYGPEVGGMVAEGAEANPSVFSINPVPWNEIILEFLQICFKFENHPSNTKYILLNQIPSKSKYYQKFARMKTNLDMLNLAKELQVDKDEPLNGKIKFRHLQKERLQTIEQYSAWKKEVISKLSQDIENVSLGPIDFTKEFSDVGVESSEETVESKSHVTDTNTSTTKITTKRRLSLDNTLPHKTLKST